MLMFICALLYGQSQVNGVIQTDARCADVSPMFRHDGCVTSGAIITDVVAYFGDPNGLSSCEEAITVPMNQCVVNIATADPKYFREIQRKCLGKIKCDDFPIKSRDDTKCTWFGSLTDFVVIRYDCVRLETTSILANDHNVPQTTTANWNGTEIITQYPDSTSALGEKKTNTVVISSVAVVVVIVLVAVIVITLEYRRRKTTAYKKAAQTLMSLHYPCTFEALEHDEDPGAVTLTRQEAIVNQRDKDIVDRYRAVPILNQIWQHADNRSSSNHASVAETFYDIADDETESFYYSVIGSVNDSVNGHLDNSIDRSVVIVDKSYVGMDSKNCVVHENTADEQSIIYEEPEPVNSAHYNQISGYEENVYSECGALSAVKHNKKSDCADDRCARDNNNKKAKRKILTQQSSEGRPLASNLAVYDDEVF